MAQDKGIRMGLIKATCAVVLLILCPEAMAQGVTDSDRLAPKHRNFAGKPCLESNGLSRATVSNPRISVHSVEIKNSCSERIKVKLCYHGSTDCSDVDVPGNSRKETVLGVLPATQMFRYDINEQF
jgi:hypothetical protein